MKATAEKIVELIENSKESYPEIRQVIEVLRKWEGKKLTTRILQEIECDAFISSAYTTTQIVLRISDKAREWPTVFVSHQTSPRPIVQEEVWYQNNRCYLDAADERNRNREEFLKDPCKAQRLVDRIDTYLEAQEQLTKSLNDCPEKYIISNFFNLENNP